MAVDQIVHQLALIEKSLMPEADVYEDMPETLGTIPAILHYVTGGTSPMGQRDVTYDFTHNIDSQILFSRVDQPASDKRVKQLIDPLRAAIDKDSKLSKRAFNSGLVSYREANVQFAGTAYIALIITTQVIEKVVAGEVAGS